MVLQLYLVLVNAKKIMEYIRNYRIIIIIIIKIFILVILRHNRRVSLHDFSYYF
jgi:hypothetical protein